MTSDQDFVDYVLDQAAGAGRLSSRKMFGEYALYLDGKVVALVCDNQLFVKPTAAGRRMLLGPKEGLPYPGAKPWFLIDEALEDSELLAMLLRATAKELPEPKPKKPKKTAAKTRRSAKSGLS